MHRALFSIVLSLLFLLNVSCADKSSEKVIIEPQIIPKPAQMDVGDGVFELTEKTTISFPKIFSSPSNFLINYLKKGANFELILKEPEKADILIEVDSLIEDEGYFLDVSKKQILIRANSSTGAFYAFQSLRQLLPPQIESADSFKKKKIHIPVVSITDQPKFTYRGMHLDVARHFFPKEFIKEYIAYLAMLKMNYFHWHLTEDQGWRIEIEKFPRLTSHAAYRDETLIGHYNSTPQIFDGKRYGGYYTKEDIKEIVAFATEHHITIIPEIEMPGHAQAAISAYPELGCAGEQVPVATKWGVFENIYCPNQKTFAFLKGVLSEVMELFPGEYVHIGGDEAPKKQWQQCAHCQKLIKGLNLKDEHELQSWFIKEIETFLNDNGKKMIGWDEILEGGLAPNATVMSWRGTQGGIEAAKAGHNVIMTPTSHAYFDYYQSDDQGEPLAIGGFLPLEKVYGFNPVPSDLNNEEAKYVLGAQGNVWTEYMKTGEQVEYMIFPRMLAMSEVVWSGPSGNKEENYPEFVNRVENFHDRLNAMQVNYANHLYTIKGAVVKRNDSVFYELSTPTKGKTIRYSLNADASLYDYSEPIPLSEDGTLGNKHIIGAAVYKNDSILGNRFVQEIKIHKGVKGSVSLNVEPHPSYGAGGKDALINGISGSDTRYGDSEWLGFWGDDLKILIDLSEERQVNMVKTRFYHAPGQWIYAPKTISVTRDFADGASLNTISPIEPDPESTVTTVSLKLKTPIDKQIKKLIIRIPNFGVIPNGKQGAGNKAWTFIDEIIIE
ncbi:MAG: beta-N-acetylhexosaminidase [Bacteroidia bacterium]|nr:beta-N-acetylhexosaminidase [Bacteroidia bacterium]NNK53987.1 beta-N-acetylhexosaminidase [Flavobacteriaceae bacterium]